jgi:predicted dehydrogenase
MRVMRTIRWGMIGCGDVAEVKSGPGFYKAPHSSLVAVMRRNGALAEDFARRHGVARWHDDADAIIEAPDIDAVYIATHTDTHHDYTLRCAAAGKPVYVEKPMAMSHRQCQAMIAACAAAGVPLWVAYYRRALPRFLKVKALIEDGAIGTVRLVRSQQFARLPGAAFAHDPKAWRVNPVLSGGGFFFEGACHTLDFLDFLFGPIAEIKGFAANQGGAYRPEDTVTLAYRFASGLQGSGTWCYAADHEYEMNEIIGSAGRLFFSTTQPAPIRLIRGGAATELAEGDPPHVHQPLIETMVAELNGSGRCPSTGETGARTGWAMDQILGAFREG